MDSTRGLVISTPVIAKPQELTISSGPLDSQELRYWLLFWDKLNFPALDAIDIDPGADGDFLIEIDVLKRHQVSDVEITMPLDGNTKNPKQTFQHHFLRAFRELDVSEPGVWSLATGANSLTIDEHEHSEGRGILFQLHRALPVPDKNVPLAELLEFKGRRRDELISLRCRLEDIYQKIISAPDQPLASKTEFVRLDNELSQYLKVAKESSIKRWRIMDVGVELSVKRGVNAGVAAYSQGLGLTSSIVTSLAASIDIAPALGLRGLNRDNGVPWKYIASYHESIF